MPGDVAPFEVLARGLIADSLEHEPYGLQLRGARAAIARMAENSEYADGYGRAGTILDAAIDLNQRAMDAGIMKEFKAFAREYVKVGAYVNPYLAVADTAISLANNEITPEEAIGQIATLGHASVVRGTERFLEDEFRRRLEREGGPSPASSAANAARLRNHLISREIAWGHAFEKHVLGVDNPAGAEFGGLGIRTRNQFAEHIENVINNPTASGSLRNGRSYFYDGNTGTLVIRNPRAADGGTAFRIDIRRYPDPMVYIRDVLR